MLDRYFWSVSEPISDDFSDVQQDSPDWPDVQLQLGLAHLRAGDTDHAITHLKNSCFRKPDMLVARLGLAAAYADKAMMTDALDELEIANQNQPGELEILFSIGFCNEALGELGKAMDYYQDVVLNDPSFIPARERLAAIAIATNETELAIEQYTYICEQNPHRTHLHAALAHLHYTQGNYESAIEEYETAIALEPDNWSLLDDEVEALIADGQIRDAIDKLHILMEQQGDFADLNVRLGDLYSQVGDDSAALQHYHNAIEIQPDYLEAIVKLGTHHLVSGRWDQAAETFYDATEINDRMILSYIGLGVSHLAAGNEQEAVNNFDLATSIEPNSSLLLTEMARLQLKAAVADEFLKNFAIHPDEPVDDISLDNDDLLQKQLVRHRRRN